MDPLSIIAGTTGTLAFAVHAADSLHGYISNIVNAPQDIVAISRDVEALSRILEILEGWLQLGVVRPEAAKSLSASLNVCVQAMSRLNITLRPFTTPVPGQSDKDIPKLKWQSSFRWAFKRAEVRDLWAEVQQAKVTLGISLNIVNTYANESGNAKLRGQIDAGDAAIRNDIARLTRAITRRRKKRAIANKSGNQKKSLEPVEELEPPPPFDEHVLLDTPPSHPWAGIGDIDDILSIRSFSLATSDSVWSSPRLAAVSESPKTSATVESSQLSSLELAFRADDFRSLLRLLSESGDPNELISDGGTVLHACAVKNDPIMAEVLLLKGASPIVLNREHQTPLQCALTNHSTRTSCLLLQHRAHTNDFFRFMLHKSRNPGPSSQEDSALIIACLHHIADECDTKVQNAISTSIENLPPDDLQSLRQMLDDLGIPPWEEKLLEEVKPISSAVDNDFPSIVNTPEHFLKGAEVIEPWSIPLLDIDDAETLPTTSKD